MLFIDEQGKYSNNDLILKKFQLNGKSVLDEKTTESIENILYGQIYIQPTRTAEFIILDFNILPTGASFNA